MRVYPNLQEGRRQALYLIRSRQIAMEKRRANGTGAGRDFEQPARVPPGDERRDVCWTASARRGRLVTKIYQPERSQTVLDARRRRPADARAHGRRRARRDVTAAFALAQVALAAGDRVGLLAYGRRMQQRVAPGRGALHLRSLIDALALVRRTASKRIMRAPRRR